METMRSLAALFLSLALTLPAHANSGQARSPQPSETPPTIGDRSPALDIEELLNAPADASPTLEALRGNIVVLEFWATWCAPCIAEIPRLNALREAFRDRGVVFISVTQESREIVERFQRTTKTPIDGWIGLDRDGSLSEAFGIRLLPQTVVLDGYGRIAAITAPSHLTPERIEAFLSGHRDAVAPGTRADRTAEDPRNLFAEIQDAPDFHIEIRSRPPAALDKPRMEMSNNYAFFDAYSAEDMLARALGTGTRYLAFDGYNPPNRRYDIVFRRAAGFRPSDHDHLDEVILDTLGVIARTETREFDGFRLVQIEGGHTLSPAPEEFGAVSIGKMLEAPRGRTASIASWCDRITGKPVEDGTGVSDEWFSISIGPVEDGDVGSLRQALREQAGLDLVPARVERTVHVVSPREDVMVLPPH
jgi:thiol-disulfide isomerase/thioredoxin